MNIHLIIQQAASRLEPLTENPRLEAELLLCEVLNVSRAYLYTYPEQALTQEAQEAFERLLLRRIEGEPSAYILGRKAFWSLDLEVSPATLIPRPETELLVELTLSLLPERDRLWVADLGTGSGAIALALASERPHWQLVATDISSQALIVAKKNAARLKCSQIQFYQGTWCHALPDQRYHLIVSNPPYIDCNDLEVAPCVIKYEPHSALFSDGKGLADIREIVQQAPNYLMHEGLLMLEHGADQAEAVVALFVQNQYTQIATHLDLAGKPRVTMGRWCRQ